MYACILTIRCFCSFARRTWGSHTQAKFSLWEETLYWNSSASVCFSPCQRSSTCVETKPEQSSPYQFFKLLFPYFHYPQKANINIWLKCTFYLFSVVFPSSKVPFQQYSSVLFRLLHFSYYFHLFSLCYGCLLLFTLPIDMHSSFTVSVKASNFTYSGGL